MIDGSDRLNGTHKGDLTSRYPGDCLILADALVRDDIPEWEHAWLNHFLDAAATAEPALREEDGFRRLRDLSS